MKSVGVVVPIYRSKLPERERKLLRHNMEQLRGYEILLVAPIALEISELLADISLFDVGNNIRVVRVDNEWLGVENGVKGYNKMMLSTEFYEIFVEYEYVLICQTDCYIFKGDELRKWCSRGYDYIGAPWPKKTIYDNWFVQRFYRLLHSLSWEKRCAGRIDILGKIGNGGLSLRKVKSCIIALQKQAYIAAIFRDAKEHNLNNEDIFWALVPGDFRYPTYEEAFRFAIDTKPQEAMEILQKGIGESSSEDALPFGCHGLNNKKIWSYWQERLSKFL